MRESIRQDVVHRDVHGLLEEIVLEDDEASVDHARVVDDAVPVVQDLLRVRGAASDVEVWNIMERQHLQGRGCR